MADETQTAEVQTEEQAAQEEPHGVDWTAEARKWEARAKENKAAADELARLKESQMTEQQKAEARAQAAEARVAQLEAEVEKTAAARKFAQETGTPESLLLLCEDTASMDALCKEWAKQSAPAHVGAAAPAQRIVRPEGSRDAKGALSDFFNTAFS